MMIVEIISTGTELLLGHVVNTNASFLARQLNELGFDVFYQSTVGDNCERMKSVLQTALERADIIITSGGLGPTQGDITKEVIAQLCEKKLQLHQESLEKIEAYFAGRGIRMPQNNLRQAMLPEGCLVMENEVGTAPGTILSYREKWIISLPGPPHELEHMFRQGVAPFLARQFKRQGQILSHIIHTYGIGESLLEEKIMDFIKAQSNPTIALLAKEGEIIIRLTAKADDEKSANDLLRELECRLRERIGRYIWGTGDDKIEEVLASLLQKEGMKISLAESCTGGLASHWLTNISGSSSYLKGTLVCYSEASKTKHLAVPTEMIEAHGVVSREVATRMAQGALTMFDADLAIGITGWAQQSPQTDDAGHICIAVASAEGKSRSEAFVFRGERLTVKSRAAKAALHLAREFIEEKNTNNRRIYHFDKSNTRKTIIR